MRPLDPLEIPLSGVRLIEANAGTGKTFTITTLYLRLLLERSLEISRILVVTYTNAATAQLRSKVRDRIAATVAALHDVAPPPDDDTARLVERRRAAGSVAADCRRLEAALYGFDEAAIFTIHGFCQRVLQEHAFESGVSFDAELIGDDRLLVEEVVRDFWTRELYAAPLQLVRSLGSLTPAALARLARLVTAHPGARIVPARPDVDLCAALAAGADLEAALAARRLQLPIDLAAFAERELRQRKERNNTQSFDDLLQQLASGLDGAGGAMLAQRIRQRFPVAMIDEFQDTDPTQTRIFEAAYRHPEASLFLIGDPKQAIYGFRGADVFTYVGAKARVGEDVYGLGTNWRSGPALVRAVNSLFAEVRAPFLLPGIPFASSSPAPEARDMLGGAMAGRAPLRFVVVGTAGRTLDKRTGRILSAADSLGWFHDAMAGEITALLNSPASLDGRQLLPADVAVLSRNNRQSAAMQASLDALGVPSVMYGEQSVFETAEADALGRVMHAMAEPGDSRAIAVALLTPILGLTCDDLSAARRDEAAWAAWVEKFQAWAEAWKTGGFTVAFRRLLDDQGVLERILSRAGGERSLTNTLHLAELLQQAAVDARRGPLALVEWLQRMCHDSVARVDEVGEAAQIRLESDTRALKLITVHKSKGLEFPVVVCPFLWDGNLVHRNDRQFVRFHDAADGQRMTIDVGSERKTAHQALAQREALAEHLRLLYVALTRAEQLCIVPWGRFNTGESSALGYVLHQDDAAVADNLVEATKARIAALTETTLRADLDRLAARAAGGIEVTDLATGPAARYSAPAATHSELAVRCMSRAVPQSFRLASFSALASGERELTEPAEEGIDRDEIAERAALGNEAAAATVRGFPRGRRLGNLVHRLFETIDFAAVEPAALRAHAGPLLPGYGVEPQWLEPICDAIVDVLDTPLADGATSFTLRQVPQARRLNELEFVFPVALDAVGALAAPAAGATAQPVDDRRGQLALRFDAPPARPARGGEGAAFTASHLAGVMAEHGAPWLAPYAARLARLPFGQLAGYLKGFIDLVFVHEGRWFLADYKTNDLGERSADYRAPRLRLEMQRHDYVLQYHLYTVALHRYLRQRVAGYRYERDFGGVLYLFVRGMAPRHEPGCGVFFDRPPQALIEALSDGMTRPAAAGVQRGVA